VVREKGGGAWRPARLSDITILFPVTTGIEAYENALESATAMGSHAGTPVGLCAARAVRRAKFPKFGKPSLTVKYPFKL